MLCKNAPNAVKELVNWGARFHREKDGRLTQRFFGTHTYRRTIFYGDCTGNEIIRVLKDQIQQRQIEIIDNGYITKLLKSDDLIEEVRTGEGEEVKGVLGIDILIFECKSLILASGGYTRVNDK